MSASRYFDFPFVAVEEALSNAVYHKSYELGSPIEVQVWPDKIEILSFPGPVPPVNAAILKTHKRIVAREYRNRRIGDSLKELRLTEGRGTGFPTIYNVMAENGSPVPVFETDVESTYFLVTLLAHAAIGNGAIVLLFSSMEEIIAYGNGASNGASNGAGNRAGSPAGEILNAQIHERVSEMLEILTKKMKRAELFERMELTNQSKNREKFLDPLIDIGWIKKEYPEDVTNPNQRY